MADLAAAKHSDSHCVEGQQEDQNQSLETAMVSVRFEQTTLTTEGSTEPLPEQVNGELASAVNRPKKSLFEITSVVNTENDFGRGESHGNEFDSELDDTFTEASKASTPDDLGSSSDSQSQSNATSRFRIVKILRTEPYKKGRWQCQDMLDNENKQSDLNKNSPNNGAAVAGNVLGESQAIEPSTNSLHNSAGSEHSARLSDRGGGGTYQTDDSSHGANGTSSKAMSSAHGGGQQTSYQQSNNKLDTALSTTGLQNEADMTAPSRRYSNESSHSTIDVPNSMPSVQPMVNTIETALDQISAIKSTLLSAFNDQVPTLKQTISTLSDENATLREENQRLKQALMRERRGQSSEMPPDTLPRDKS